MHRAESVHRAHAARDARPAALTAQRRSSAAAERARERLESQRRHDERVSVARRLALVLIALGASFMLLSRLRRRRSRYLPAGMAAVAAVSLLALVMAFAGVEETRRLYSVAIAERYRFYSFGDAMLVL